MAMSYSTALKNDRMQKVIDRIDAGAGNGILKIGTAAMGTILAQITLAKPSFGAPSAGAITLAGTPLSDTDADASGTAAAAQITDSTGSVIVDGLTVGTSGTHIVLPTTQIDQHEEVRINSGTITHG